MIVLKIHARRGVVRSTCYDIEHERKGECLVCRLGFKIVGRNGRKQRISPMLKQLNINLAPGKCPRPRRHRSIITEINPFNYRPVVALVARAVVVVRSVLTARTIESTIQEQCQCLPFLSPFLPRPRFHCFTWIPSHIYCNHPAHRIKVSCHHQRCWTNGAVRSPLHLPRQSCFPKVNIVHRRRAQFRRQVTITKTMRTSNRNAWPSLGPARDKKQSSVRTWIAFFLSFRCVRHFLSLSLLFVFFNKHQPVLWHIISHSRVKHRTTPSLLSWTTTLGSSKTYWHKDSDISLQRNCSWLTCRATSSLVCVEVKRVNKENWAYSKRSKIDFGRN